MSKNTACPLDCYDACEIIYDKGIVKAINIELRKKEDKLWYVSSAMLTVEGAQLKLPVKMDRKGKPIKIFK